MAASVPTKLKEASGKNVWNKPREPSKALKPAATTTVGSMNGTAVKVRRMDLPGKL